MHPGYFPLSTDKMQHFTLNLHVIDNIKFLISETTEKMRRHLKTVSSHNK